MSDLGKSVEMSEVELHNYYLAEKATTTLNFNSNLSVFSEARTYCATQIVCTIGPACSSLDVLGSMINNGMNIARLNFSHGDHEFHGKLIALVREATAAAYPMPIAIALDTKGPEIRTGNTVDNKNITLETGKKITLTSDEQYKDSCSSEVIYLDYKSLQKSCKPGQKILLADGSATLQVTHQNFDKGVECKILSGASFGSRKNCCIPGVAVDLPALSEKDIKDIEFGCKQGVDIIFASFVRNRENVVEIKNVLKRCGCENKIKIISKIENFEGVNKIDEIIDESDGIMVARGDLGMDLPLYKVVTAQKKIISKCNMAGKPVICATQMMESMINNRRPTRAEVSDIANAVLDGADCVMLSGETANGKFPAVAVKKMNKTCREAEDIIFYKMIYEDIKNSKIHMSVKDSISMAASSVSFKVHADAIIVLSTSGASASLISHYRPRCPIIAVTRSATVARQCLLFRGIFPLVYDKEFSGSWETDVEERLGFAIQRGKKLGILMSDSKVVFVCGWQKGPGYSNTLRILNVGSDDTIKGMKKSMSELKV